ncbi:MAG: hypothetical protein JNL13_08680 [Chitinophagaceae bacterium]|nr:hypothetical protein [Chitinophagaceae bacterium]
MAIYIDSSELLVPVAQPGFLPEACAPIVPFRSMDSLLPDLLRCPLEQRLQLIENLLCSERK